MNFLTALNPVAGPSVAWIVLGVTVAAGGFGFYGGYRWAEAGVVKCELKAEKKEVAQGKANTLEVKRQTQASNKAARGLEADRDANTTQFTEVRNEQTETALAQPDRANVLCFDDEWLRLDAAATRAANSRLTHGTGAVKPVPPAAGAEARQSGLDPVRPHAPGGAVRGLRDDASTPGAVGQAARNPEKN